MEIETYFRMNELIAGVVPASETTIKRWLKKGTFPKPVTLGPRLVAWKRSDIAQWQASKQTPTP